MNFEPGAILEALKSSYCAYVFINEGRSRARRAMKNKVIVKRKTALVGRKGAISDDSSLDKNALVGFKGGKLRR